jgi:nicotinamide riboside kinase
MTAVWADMMLGRRDPWFQHFRDTADLYLLLNIDLPFVDDGLRIYGEEQDRARFFALCLVELERRKLPWALVSGTGEARLESALAAIRAAFGTSIGR